MHISLYELIKEYGKGKGESVMWATVKHLSDFIEPMREAHPTEYWQFIKETYAEMAGEHYNEMFGSWQIAQMSYKDKTGEVHSSPHWTTAQYKTVYEKVKSRIKSQAYTCWDFAVTLEMIYSDNICMYKTWWPDATEEDLTVKVIDAAINFLNDDDNPECKIWRYFNK